MTHAGADLRLSIIIPLAPRETRVPGLLDQLRHLPADTEIILAGVAGDTQPLQRRLQCGALRLRRSTSAAGRARQMNAAARQAHGHWLWFLHADSRVFPETLAALDRFLAQRRQALGYFDLRFDDDGPPLTWLNARAANLRSRWLGMPFGDQGFVILRTVFERLGGYDETLNRGEDHAFVWRARAAGVALARIPAPLATSARRYAEQGWLRLSAAHLARTAAQAWSGWRVVARARRR